MISSHLFVMLENLDKFKCLKRGISGISLDPLQRGGILYPEAKEALYEWGDGYSVCDFCSGEIDKIKNPPIEDFVHKALPEFLGADDVRITHGAREGMFAAMNCLCQKGDYVVVDGNAHYTTILAAERAGLKIEYVQRSGAPDYKVNASDYIAAFQRVKDAGGKASMGVLTYPDGNYGNIVDPLEVSRICHDEGALFMLNGAYSVGRMPVHAGRLGVDIIVGSGHKSMASCGPIGVLGTTNDVGDTIFRKSSYQKNKEVELLGCTVRGAGLITMMASFPYVVERVQHYDDEIEKARWFSKQLGALGIVLQGDVPHNHDLMFFKSDVLYQISSKAKKGRYFLYRDLKQKGICGIKAGLTKQFKLSTYLLSKDELETVVKAFSDIIENYT